MELDLGCKGPREAIGWISLDVLVVTKDLRIGINSLHLSPCVALIKA